MDLIQFDSERLIYNVLLPQKILFNQKLYENLRKLSRLRKD